MPRQARIDFPGALHHVINRGIERKFIFEKDEDKKEMLRRFRCVLEESDAECYAWSIMGNHFHILLQTGQTLLSEIMRKLLTGYDVYYNRKNNRVGYLFQNRYKSIICNKDEYFLPLIRYIHLNPVKAHVIKYEELEKFIWSGHYELLRKRKDGIINRKEVLCHFGRSEREGKEEMNI